MTAVEWLKFKIIEDIRLNDLISGYYSKEQYKQFLIYKLEQALELEKQQIIDAYQWGYKLNSIGNELKEAYVERCSEQYYSETFKKTL